MKIINSIKLLTLVGALLLVSCSDDDTIEPNEGNGENIQTENVEIQILSNSETLFYGDTLMLAASGIDSLECELAWIINDEQVSTDDTLSFSSTQLGTYNIKLQASTNDTILNSQLNVEVYLNYSDGTFVLNEGSAFQHNGNLSFITNNGYIIDSVYYKNNNEVGFGSVAQDLFIANNKLYVVCQNGQSLSEPAEGYLTIANAETMEKEMSFQDELSSLSWPTNVAALSDTAVYIRDNNGINLFNPSNNKLTFIEGSKGANKSRLVVCNEVLFVPSGSSVLVIEKNKSEISKSIDFDYPVKSITKTNDGNIWVATSNGSLQIHKLSSSDFTVTKTNSLDYNGSTISAVGDTIYFNNSMAMYRHIFSLGETEYLLDVSEYVEDANILYNAPRINPVTGELYINTLKGWGSDYLINNISVFNFSGETPELVKNYSNHTAFPAGIFFTENFKQ